MGLLIQISNWNISLYLHVQELYMYIKAKLSDRRDHATYWKTKNCNKNSSLILIERSSSFIFSKHKNLSQVYTNSSTLVLWPGCQGATNSFKKAYCLSTDNQN